GFLSSSLYLSDRTAGTTNIKSTIIPIKIKNNTETETIINLPFYRSVSCLHTILLNYFIPNLCYIRCVDNHHNFYRFHFCNKPLLFSQNSCKNMQQLFSKLT